VECTRKTFIRSNSCLIIFWKLLYILYIHCTVIFVGGGIRTRIPGPVCVHQKIIILSTIYIYLSTVSIYHCSIHTDGKFSSTSLCCKLYYQFHSEFVEFVGYHHCVDSFNKVGFRNCVVEISAIFKCMDVSVGYFEATLHVPRLLV
jgi:hypothetical protein